MAAPVAAEAREAARKHAAGEELAELVLDEAGQALAGAAGSRLGEKLSYSSVAALKP